MKINQFQNNQMLPGTKNQKTQPKFKATPKQILTAVETAQMCPGKKMFLQRIANFFLNAEEQLNKISEAPKEYIFRLGQKNKIPNTMEKINLEVGTKENPKTIISLKDIDDSLNQESFKCSPTSSCSCGKNLSKGEYMASLLKTIGIEEPNEIKISKK